MSKSGKEKFVKGLKRMIGEAEDFLIDTPDEITAEEYQEAIERIKHLRETLRLVLKM